MTIGKVGPPIQNWNPLSFLSVSVPLSKDVSVTLGAFLSDLERTFGKP